MGHPTRGLAGRKAVAIATEFGAVVARAACRIVQSLFESAFVPWISCESNYVVIDHHVQQLLVSAEKDSGIEYETSLTQSHNI